MLSASNIRANNKTKYGPAYLLDDDRYSYWATGDGVNIPGLIITLPRKTSFDIIQLRENIKLGQRIDSVSVDMMQDKNGWK